MPSEARQEQRAVPIPRTICLTGRQIPLNGGILQVAPLTTILTGLRNWKYSSGYIDNARKVDELLNTKTDPLEYKKSKAIAHVLESYSPTFVPLVRKPEIGYDAKLIPLLLSTELFGTKTLKTFDSFSFDRKTKFVSVDEKVGGDLQFAMRTMERMPGVTPLSRVVNYHVAVSYLEAHKRLRAALELKTGTYTFGVPRIYRPEDLGISIRSIHQRMHDVYVIIFWITDWHLFSDKVSESWFITKLGDDAVALELVPLRYDKVLHLEEESKSPPGIG